MKVVLNQTVNQNVMKIVVNHIRLQVIQNMIMNQIKLQVIRNMVKVVNQYVMIMKILVQYQVLIQNGKN